MNRWLTLLTAVVSFAAVIPTNASAQSSSDTPGLGPAGTLQAIVFEETIEPALHGPDSRRQLLVTGRYSSGQMHDLSKTVAYAVAPAGVLTVGAGGFVTPVAEGKATITARVSSGQTTTLEVTVDQFGQEKSINFSNQIVPLFTKLGCNTGACHGKSGGQNGFRMSLLGFYPEEDYEYLVKENQGRRIFPSSPEYSLLLTKPTNVLAHGGGKRIDMDSFEARLLIRWIDQGMPFGSEDDPVVEKIEVFPKSRKMNRGADQQLTVVAHYSDGSKADVTRMVKFESNDPELTEITATGVVKTLDVPGEVAIMVRFQDHVTVFRSIIPMGLPVTLPPAKNYIDQHVFARLQDLGIPPSKVCDDSTFIRRVTVDITGRLPASEEVTAFLASTAGNKRDLLIDRLLASGDYADLFANKWISVLRNRQNAQSGADVTKAFHKFVRDSMAANMPYDQFVRTILTASGDTRTVAPANWFAQVATPVTQAEDVAQLFLGLRIQCAHCHHHPFEKWTQDDYFGLTAFFTRTKRTQVKIGKNQNDQRRMTIAFDPGVAQSLNPRTKLNVKPTPLEGEPLELTNDQDPRIAFAAWMTAPENPFFARTLVNRYWKHFFGRGIVEPEDDMRVTNPPSNPALLDALEAGFKQSKFNLKELVKTICQSTAYQLDSVPNEYNADDRQNFSRYFGRRMQAEVLLDAIDQVTKTQTTFAKLPAGTRALQLPDNSFDTYFLTVFGKPKAASACECERSDDANLAQALHLLNSPEVQAKLAAKDGRTQLLAADETRSHAERVTELYQTVFARPPREDEMALVMKHLQRAESPQQGYEDLLWALINTKEFLFNH
jgi:hypothetical protein